MIFLARKKVGQQFFSPPLFSVAVFWIEDGQKLGSRFRDEHPGSGTYLICVFFFYQTCYILEMRVSGRGC